MGLYLTLMTDIDPYICPHVIFYQSDLFTHEKLNLHGDNEKKKRDWS